MKYSLFLSFATCINNSYTSATPLQWPNLVLKKREKGEGKCWSYIIAGGGLFH